MVVPPLLRADRAAVPTTRHDHEERERHDTSEVSTVHEDIDINSTTTSEESELSTRDDCNSSCIDVAASSQDEGGGGPSMATSTSSSSALTRRGRGQSSRTSRDQHHVEPPGSTSSTSSRNVNNTNHNQGLFRGGTPQIAVGNELTAWRRLLSTYTAIEGATVLFLYWSIVGFSGNIVSSLTWILGALLLFWWGIRREKASNCEKSDSLLTATTSCYNSKKKSNCENEVHQVVQKGTRSRAASDFLPAFLRKPDQEQESEKQENSNNYSRSSITTTSSRTSSSRVKNKQQRERGRSSNIEATSHQPDPRQGHQNDPRVEDLDLQLLERLPLSRLWSCCIFETFRR
ncbi:unnamed protein product, partial [Amoebophrya sp. A25]|eukprot:GSA25T00020720001.1